MRTSSDVISSRQTASFRTVLAHDARGLPQCFCFEIMTLRRLTAKPKYTVRAGGPPGCLWIGRNGKPC